MLVSILYQSDLTLSIHCETLDLPQNESGRVIIPAEFKTNRTVLVVCKGKIEVMNRIGDRIIGELDKTESIQYETRD